MTDLVSSYLHPDAVVEAELAIPEVAQHPPHPNGSPPILDLLAAIPCHPRGKSLELQQSRGQHDRVAMGAPPVGQERAELGALEVSVLVELGQVPEEALDAGDGQHAADDAGTGLARPEVGASGVGRPATSHA